MRKNVVMLALTSLLAGHAIADSGRALLCDRLAAGPYDPHRVSEPVNLDEIDADRAINACHHAISMNPQSYRDMYQLGRSYAAADRDYDSFLWMRKAAQKGYPAAQAILGAYYIVGTGTKKDLNAGLMWTRKAAYDYNLAEAQFNLGYLYHHGLGVKVNIDKALGLYNKASDGGYAEAQFTLGYLYSQGQHLNKSIFKAKRYYHLSAKQGNVRAMERLADIYYSEANYKPAIDWYRRATDKGSAWGQKALGFSYFGGTGVEKNLAESARWFRLSAEQGDAEAQTNLAAMYYQGMGVNKNYAEAAKWFTKASEQGNADAMFWLGVFHVGGMGVKRNMDYAEWLFKEAVAKGNENAKEGVRLMQEYRKKESQSSDINWGVVALGLLVGAALISDDEVSSDNSGGSSERNTEIPIDTYDPCSNPWYADESPFC